MKSNPDNNKADQVYSISYDSEMTTKFIGSRTVETHAAWFLPYLQPGMTLIDVGCASGSITVGLAKAVEPGQVTGVDLSEIEIKRARERAAENKISNIHFEVGNTYQLDFPDDSFDTLFSHNVLEHIPEPSRVLQEMYRVLKPGGVIGIRDVDWGGTLSAPNDELLVRSGVIYTADWEKTGGHPRIGRHLGRLLHEAGYTDVEMSASYNVFAGPEQCRLIAQAAISHLTQADLVKRVTEGGLTTVEELESIRKAWQTWQESPFAFRAVSHCEAIGRKA